MFSKKILLFLLVLLFTATGISTAATLEPIEQLGKSIFFDKNLSINKNQACVACHAPEVGWTGPLIRKSTPLAQFMKARFQVGSVTANRPQLLTLVIALFWTTLKGCGLVVCSGDGRGQQAGN